MGWIKNYREFIAHKQEETRALTLEDILLEIGISTTGVTAAQARNIPTISAGLELISNTIATIPIVLYSESEGKVKTIKDNRVKLLNDETGDTLDGFQFKKALINDYLLEGNGYAYINREKNKVKSLHYVPKVNVSVSMNTDSIFKDYDILVQGEKYKPWEFIKLIKNTKNGASGTGLLQDNNDILTVAYNTTVFENVLVRTGGNKKGFLQSEKKISKESMDELKAAFKKLYSTSAENVIVLNEGISFKEASNTSVEMQLNENKETNSKEIASLLNMPTPLISGKATADEYANFIKLCIMPILTAFKTALNKDLLLETEKGTMYFDFDVSELLKGDIVNRYNAYESAVRAGWLSKNEIRYTENYEPIDGLDVVSMSLGDVIYDIKSKSYFTPNMDSTNNLSKPNDIAEGGE